MAIRKMIFDSTNGHCFYCGCPLDIGTFHVDHFVPKASGGRDFGNRVPSCSDCNEQKGTLDIEQFRERIGSLRCVSHHGRLMAKYYEIEDKPVVFYFEKEGISGNGR